MHKPTPEMAVQTMCSSWLHCAPEPPGVQSSAQYLSPDWSCKTHCGFATVSGQVSVGHPPDAVHFGAQKAPGTPEMVTFASPAWHASVLNGSSYSHLAWALMLPSRAFSRPGSKSTLTAGDAYAVTANSARIAIANFIVFNLSCFVCCFSVWVRFGFRCRRVHPDAATVTNLPVLLCGSSSRIKEEEERTTTTTQHIVDIF